MSAKGRIDVLFRIEPKVLVTHLYSFIHLNEFKENLKVKNMLKNDLTKCIMRKCNLLDKTGKKSRSYVEKNVKPVKTTSVSPVSQDCIIVQEAQ